MVETAVALRVQGLKKSYGDVSVLDDVSLEVPGGQCTAILGPSGSGKSTLMRIVAGLVDADAGRVEVLGQVTDDPRRRVAPEKRGVALLFQDLALWPHMTVRGNLDFVLEARGVSKSERRAKGEAAAEGAEFPASLLDRKPSEISGGERQRAAIARALAQQPRLVLLDEPLSHLDPALRATLLLELRRLREKHGLSTLLVTHEVGEAFALAQTVVVLRRGRVEQAAAPRDIYERPRSRFVAEFVGRASILPATRGAGRIETPLGTFSDSGAPAGAVVAVVRPERVRATDGGARARIVDSVFQGDHWLWQTELAQGARVLVRSTSPAVPGQEVALTADVPAFVPDDVECRR
ncbi:MAG: ABC transporter ATP-binding protein [Planctomycetes bacterium]|nr:ABC transporter ATP-binding protein [Planctomycetota bacterium]